MDEALLDTQSKFILPDGKGLWGLDKRLTKALKKMSIQRPTIVQAQVIPLALEGKDVLVRSRTGSGKTLAYLLPMIQKVLSKRDTSGGRATSGIVLVPTRELCDQVEATLTVLLQYCADVVSFASLGAGSAEARKARLRENPDVLVSTPGRLAEHMREDEFLLKNQGETLVVDESDLVLSFGYEADVKLVTSRLSRTCQGMLLSATLEEDINALKQIVLNDPVIIKLRDDEEVEASKALKQWYIRINKQDKDLVTFSLLKLSLIAPGKALYFVNTVDRGYRLKLFFEQFGVKAAVLNAELPENSRRHILDSYEKGLFDHLIATDESMDADEPRDEFGVARGVDFRGVQTVVNVDMPATSEEYVHRIGRTARAGVAGTALSLVMANEEENLLKQIQEEQPKRAEDGEPQPCQLALDIAELEGFRYRVDGMVTAITKNAIKTARLKDVRNEMLNSDKLQAHFQDNPRDLQLLKHDAPLRAVKVQRHLSTVPDYLVPSGLVDQHRAAIGSSSRAVVVSRDDMPPEAGNKRKLKKKKQQKKRRRLDPLL
jgi:ATP-dependent RNA helicase DDX56/DBP9